MITRLLMIIGREWWGMTIAALLGCMAVGSNIALMSFSAYIISAAALHPSITELSIAIVGVRFFGISRAIFRYLERYVSHAVTFRLLENLRFWFYRKLEPLAPARLAGQRSGELLAGIVGDVETLRDFYLRAIAPPVVALLVLLGVCFFLFSFTEHLVVLMLGSFFFGGIVLPVFLRLFQQKTARLMVKLRAELKAELVDVMNGMNEIVVFDQVKAEAQRIRTIGERLDEQEKDKAFWNGMAEALSMFVLNGTIWLVLWITIPLITEGRIEGVYFAVIMLVVQSSFEAVLPLSAAVHYLSESRAAAVRLFRLADLPPAVNEGVGEGIDLKRTDVYVEDLCFRYDVKGPLVLKHLSFYVPQGGKLAVVGPSGAGKSTLVHIFLRFWEYEKGIIKIGGTDHRAFTPEKLRELFSVVSQDTHIFNTTLRENILMARPGASQRELQAAIRGAGLENFITSLPQGYDTIAGDNGYAMSGGQRQRIAIARALVKNAPILILDEPTTGLDALTEQAVMAAIEQLMEKRTVIWITHRLTGLEKVDNILVIEQGAIIETGSHKELIKRKGAFYRLWRLQQDVFP